MRREQIGDCELWLGRCEDALPAMADIDAIVVDPPYGIGEAAGANSSRSNLAVARDYGNEDWDDRPLASSTIDLWRAKSLWQIIFGGNYYSLPPTRCWLVWDKQNGASDFADCELAWTNLPKAVRRIQWMWNGMFRKGGEERGFHPTQKPVGVMEWAIGHLPASVQTVCDPTMGSGTTGIACVNLNKRFIGIEQSEKYFDIAARRIEAAYKQPRLVDEPKAKAEQLGIFSHA